LRSDERLRRRAADGTSIASRGAPRFIRFPCRRSGATGIDGEIQPAIARPGLGLEVFAMSAPIRALAASSAIACLVVSALHAQELPKSGTYGVDLVYATDPATNTSQLYFVDAISQSALPLGNAFTGVPSRWAHRRRTLGALETSIELAEPFVVMTPLGDAAGNGAIHFLDARTGSILADFVVATGNPAGYDLALFPPLQMAFTAEDDGAGGTTLRGFSYATAGAFTALNPPTLTLPGTPSAYVNRIGVDLASQTLQVPTVLGNQIVQLAAASPQMALGTFVAAGSHPPTTNPIAFDRPDGRIWIVGTSAFDFAGNPTESGFLAWKVDGSQSWSDVFGIIPGRFPMRSYAPAVGAEELAVVSDGTDAWVYSLLRDPDPSSAFVRAAAVGVIRFLGNVDPAVSKLIGPGRMGEPFAIPTVWNGRVAIESSEGPPWWATPPGGSERISIVYSPLDPLGAATQDGVLAVAGPLGGRVSCKGMDRPLWARDGSGVFATTSNYSGAPNPGSPGIEFLPVSATVTVDNRTLAALVVGNLNGTDQSITLGSSFDPDDATRGAVLDGISLCGTVFHDGLGSALEYKDGRKLIGQKQVHAPKFVQSTKIPEFPAIFPPTFDDATGSLVPIPDTMGARRTTFDFHPGLGLIGLTMVAAMGDVVYVQPTGYDMLAALGLVPSLDPLPIALPTGWITSSEIRSW
jgi:hypothetical protein